MRTSIHSILTLVAAGLLVIVCAGCSAQARKARHLQQADRYFSAGQYDRAEIEYINVLQIEPLNPQAISRLGLIYFDQARVGRAIPFLLKGRELQPNNLDLRLKLGLLYLTTGKLKEARDEADFLLDHRPQDEDAPLLLAETAVRPKEIDEARQRLQNLPSPAAGGAPVLVALGTLDFRQRDFTAAEAAFRRAQSVDPKSSVAFLALAHLYRTQNDLPRAEAAFEAAARLAPDRSAKRLQYAQFKIQNGNVEAGRRMLKEMTQKTPDYLPAWIWLAEIAATEKKFDESAALVAKVLARDPANPEALLLSSRLWLARGESDKAVAELERMQKIYPQSPQVHYQLGVACLAAGEIGKAAASLNRAVTLAPGYADAIVLLAGLNIRRGDPSSAIIALKQLIHQRPDIAQARLLLADAYRGQGNLDDALAVYRQLEASFPRNPQTPLLMGLVFLQQNKTDEARQAFSKAFELAPDYLPALEQLINLDLLAKQYPAALERVQSQIAKNPKLAEPQLLLAKVFLAQQDTKQAEAALRKAIELQPDSRTAYFLLARLYVDTGQQQKAMANLQEVIAKNPKDAGALMLIGVIHDLQKDYVAARDAYEKLLAINPRFSPALNNLAYLYSEHFAQLDKAYEMAERARELLPHEPNTADTLGWILYKRHQYSWALSLIEESAGRLPAEAEVQFHLGMTHYMMGEEEPARLALQRALQLNKEFPGMDEAKQRLSLLAIDVKTAGADARATLEKAVADRTDDPVALARLAAIYEHDGAIDKAIDAYQAALKVSPRNVKALMNLVRLHAARKDTPKAFELAKTARNLTPGDPGIAHTLGRLAYQTGDYQWAVSLLQETARKQPDEPEVLYDLAEALYGVGRVSDAETTMRHALDVSAPLSRADEARRFLEMLALAANPSQGVVQEAKIQQTLKADPGYVPALMAMAAVNEQRSDAHAAQKNYEEVLGHYPDFSPAHKRLAILYAVNPGDNQKAYDLATKARQAFPDDPELAKTFGIIVYRQGDFTRAASLLKECSRRSNDDAELMYYLGMAQRRLKQNAESKESLQRALALHLRGDLAEEARRILAEK